MRVGETPDEQLPMAASRLDRGMMPGLQKTSSTAIASALLAGAIFWLWELLS